MIQYKQMICPISDEQVDENRVRFTALGVIIITGIFFLTGNVILPALLVLDFYIRAFTKLRHSPLSGLARMVVELTGTRPVWIDKAPKVFAARIGLILSTVMSVSALLDLWSVSYVTGAVLVAFAFLECGLNFCAGCWLYTYVVFPLVRKK
jgi:hypothetical protein